MIDTSRRSGSSGGGLCDAAETQASMPTCRISSKTKMLTWDWRGGLSDDEYTEQGQKRNPWVAQILRTLDSTQRLLNVNRSVLINTEGRVHVNRQPADELTNGSPSNGISLPTARDHSSFSRIQAANAVVDAALSRQASEMVGNGSRHCRQGWR
jgi:hypothetical protein